jgi:hypothetical protein
VSLGISAFSQSSLNIACVFKVYFLFLTLGLNARLTLRSPGFAFFQLVDSIKGRGNMRLIMKLLRDESGDTGIEYGLVAAIFAVGAVAVLQLVGVLQAP